jgi:hypothetical protein
MADIHWWNQSGITRRILNGIQHYNHQKYWKMRSVVIDSSSKVPKLIRYWYLYRIKKSDAFNNASMGTDLGGGGAFQRTAQTVAWVEWDNCWSYC